jgi:hypothetical protein
VISSYVRVHAVYHNGALTLLDPLDLPEGAQVQVDVKLMADEAKSALPTGVYPTRFVPASHFDALIGLIPAGGDALADSEALYDADWD